MNNSTDSELLRAYAQTRCESAITELVQRHLDVVYSAARRMVRDSHLAEDVTQGVFVAMTQNADKLADRSVISGWLHRTAQNIAAQTVRTIERRRSREKEAAAMNELLSTQLEPDDLWQQIAPELDAALGKLNDSERDALFLRYFERKSAHEIGAILGISEEAAQKRVSRAIDLLRELFSKRGIAVGAGGLTALISVNAVQAAPAGLAATVSGVALAGPISTVLSATKAIAMTTTQKALITTTLAIAIGVGIHQAHDAAALRKQVHTLRAQAQPLIENSDWRSQSNLMSASLADLKVENERLRRNTAELPKLRGEVVRLRSDLKDLAKLSDANDPFVKTALRWKANKAKLQQAFEDRPDQKIPELRLLSDTDWLDLARDQPFDTDADFRKAMADARRSARNTFVNSLSDALQKYVEKNDQHLPDDLSQLKPYFKDPVDDATLQGYRLLHTGKLSDLPPPPNHWVITDKAVDPQYDTPWGIGPGNFGPTGPSSDVVGGWMNDLAEPIKGFAAAHDGTSPKSADDLVPYVRNTAQSNALEQLSRVGAVFGGR